MANDDKKNEGKSKVSLEDAIKKAGVNASGLGWHTVAIAVDVGNPNINEYKVTITPGG